MRLEQFGQIIELVKTGSFSQAARNLYISQPNLSNSIKQLENELGFPLFIRTSDGVIPTRQGRDLIEHFGIIQREYDLLQQYCQTPELHSRMSLRVATLNINRTIPAFSAMVRRYMNAPVNFSFLHYTAIDPLINLVTACQVDFALIGILSPYNKNITARMQNNQIEYNRIASAPISAVIGPQNPLYCEEAISIEQLYPFAQIYYGSDSDDPSYSLLHVTGLRNRVFSRIRVNSGQMFYQTIQSTTAAGLVASAVDTFDKFNVWDDIRALKLTNCNVEAEYGWVKLRRLPLTDIAAELLEEVRNLF